MLKIKKILIHENKTITDAMKQLNQTGTRCLFVVDKKQKYKGIQKYTQIYTDIHEYTQIYTNIREYHECTQIYTRSYTNEYTPIHTNMHEYT